MNYYLVHANIALARAPLDDPLMADFITLADEIDALASRTPGFIAQPIPPDSGMVYTGEWLLNLSLWKTVEKLRNFVYEGRHKIAMDRRTDWFIQYAKPNYVLFWTPTDQIPTEVEVQSRIEHLREHGPTPFAFTFKIPYSISDLQSEEE